MALTCPCQLVLDQVNKDNSTGLLPVGTIVDAIAYRTASTYRTLNTSQYEVIDRHTFRDINTDEIYNTVFECRIGNKVYSANAYSYDGGMIGETTIRQIEEPYTEPGQLVGAFHYTAFDGFFPTHANFKNEQTVYYNPFLYEAAVDKPYSEHLVFAGKPAYNKTGSNAITEYVYFGGHEMITQGPNFGAYRAMDIAHYIQSIQLSEHGFTVEMKDEAGVRERQFMSGGGLFAKSDRYQFTTDQHRVVAVFIRNNGVPIMEVEGSWGLDQHAYNVCFDSTINKWCSIHSISGAKIEGITAFLDDAGDLWVVQANNTLKRLQGTYEHWNRLQPIEDSEVDDPRWYIPYQGYVCKDDGTGTMRLSIAAAINGNPNLGVYDGTELSPADVQGDNWQPINA